MARDNIFSGLKVVDLATFVAGPGAAVILSDFGADVIKVEPPSGDLITRAEAILKKIGANAPIAVKFALEAVYRGLETSQSEGLVLEASYFGLCAATEDKKEGTAAFLEKRAPRFRGQ